MRMNKDKRMIALLLCLSLAAPALFLPAAGLGETPSVTCSVQEIEQYGHARLDITIDDFNAAGFTLGDIITVTVGEQTWDMPYFNGYYADPGQFLVRAYPGHTYIGLCINYGRFADETGVAAGDPVTLTLKEKGGALDIQEIYNLEYGNDRADFPSDEAFANFRPVVMGSIAEGRLYRSCSPVYNKFGRAAAGNAFAEAVGINAVMNLANTPEEVTALIAQEDFASDYYKNLFESGRVIALGLGADFTSEDFRKGIAEGLAFLAGQEPPYLVHCNEGKDRAGFAAMILEALMGASAKEIEADYMLSYTDYYFTEPGSAQYEIIAEKNIREMLRYIAGLEKGASLEGVDLAAAAEKWLLSGGMTQEQLTALQEKLSAPAASELPAA